MPVSQEKAEVKKDEREYPLIPEGLYTVEVVDIILKEKVRGYKGKLVDKFYIRLGVLDESNRGFSLTHFVSTSYNSGFEGGQASKLYEFACAVMGEKLDDTQSLNVNTLIGGRLRVAIKETEIGGRIYENITEVMKADEAGKKLPELTDEELKALAFRERSESEESEESEKLEISEDDIPDIDDLLSDTTFDTQMK